MLDHRLTQLLESPQIIDTLNQELCQFIELSEIPFKVHYISSEYFTLDSQINATILEPESFNMLEGNDNTKEIKLPRNGFKMTTMLRGRKDLVAPYFRTLGQIGTIAIFIQPWILPSGVSVFAPNHGGGVLLRITTVKDTDLKRLS